MRFLRLVISPSGKERIETDLDSNPAMISPAENPGLNNVPDCLKFWVSVLADSKKSRASYGTAAGSELYLEDENSIKYKLLSSNKKITLFVHDPIHDVYTEVSHERVPGEEWPFNRLNIFRPEDVRLLSVYDPESVEQGSDPLYTDGEPARVIIRRDMTGIDPLYISGIEDIAAAREKELTSLQREIQLLELKKMKKDKLKKEIAHSTRNINRLNKQHESVQLFRSTLLEVKAKSEQRDKLSYKISETRKDLLELKEIGDKISLIEKDLKKRFPQFYNETSEGLPDMDRIQGSFNTVRDFNERIDRFHQKKRLISAKIMKGVIASSIFVFFSLIFIIIKAVTSGPASVKTMMIITTGLASFAACAFFAGYRMRKSVPASLIETKKEKENELLELLHKNNFPLENFKTGELYDFLFQYFEDFITFRDIRNELGELRKKISSTVTSTEKEKKLDSLKDRINTADEEIKKLLSGLDTSIHPVPEITAIDDTVLELKEMITDLKIKIDHENSVLSKLDSQMNEGSEPESSLLEVEAEISRISGRIEELRSEAESVKFIEDVFNGTASKFLERRQAEFKDSLRSIINRLFPAEDHGRLSEAADLLLSGAGTQTSGDLKTAIMLSIAARAALSQMFRGTDLPPAILIEPFREIPPENVEEFSKILLELFSDRQVIIFTAG